MGLAAERCWILGPAWQTTLSFFIERGFRVSSEDILREWKDFLGEEEVRLHQPGVVSETVDMTPTGRAARFLESNLQYPRASFDAVLVWDLLDYLEPALAKQAIANLTELLRPGGVVFRAFPQQEAGRISTLPHCGFQLSADYFGDRIVSRAEGLPEPRNTGPVQPIPHDEVFRKQGSASGNTFHQVKS